VTTKKQTIFGYKLHLLVTLGGVIRDYVLAPASAHDVTVAPELLGGHDGLVVLGDRGYISTRRLRRPCARSTRCTCSRRHDATRALPHPTGA